MKIVDHLSLGHSITEITLILCMNPDRNEEGLVFREKHKEDGLAFIGKQTSMGFMMCVVMYTLLFEAHAYKMEKQVQSCCWTINNVALAVVELKYQRNYKKINKLQQTNILEP